MTDGMYLAILSQNNEKERELQINLSTVKYIAGLLPSGWQHRLSLLYYRYSIRRELEPMELAVIPPLLHGGATIVDAGANIGIYSAFLAR
jgi:hypothetical protein